MKNIVKGCFWTDSIFSEGENGWYIGSDYNVLFQLNFRTGNCKFISELINCKVIDFRTYSFCIKVDHYLYCFPDTKSNIIIFDLLTKDQEVLPIRNPYKKRISSIFGGKKNNKIYVILSGLGEIIEIDTIDKKIIKYHQIADEELIRTESILINNSIVCASKWNSRLYEFNIDTYNVIVHEIPEVEFIIHTICYDGHNCWITGNERKICAYNWKEKKINAVVELPQELTVYNLNSKNELFMTKENPEKEFGFFWRSINTVDRVWFIPFRANKIIYVDKNNFKVNIFDIPNEDENANTWKRNMDQKYVVEYVLRDNLIGIYSFKNKCIYEINSDTLSVERKEYYTELADINLISKRMLSENGYILENEFINLKEHINQFKTKRLVGERHGDESVGKKIYSMM